MRRALETRLFRTLPFEANGRPAVAFYRRGDDGSARLFALQVLEVERAGVRTIDHFVGACAHRALFAAGLPQTLAGD